MYQPGGAIELLGGAVTVSELALEPVIVRPTTRWSKSKECVGEPGFDMTTEAIVAASGVEMVKGFA